MALYLYYNAVISTTTLNLNSLELDFISSFIDFIKEHYSKNTDSNNEEHQDLPFKTFEHNTNLLVVFTLINFQILINKVFFTANKTFFYKNSFKSNFFTSIWLPPKIA